MALSPQGVIDRLVAEATEAIDAELKRYPLWEWEAGGDPSICIYIPTIHLPVFHARVRRMYEESGWTIWPASTADDTTMWYFQAKAPTGKEPAQ